MNDLNERMRGVDEVPFDGDWGEVELRTASIQPMRDSAGGRPLRAIALLAATLVVLGAALYDLKDLGGEVPSAGQTPSPTSVANADLGAVAQLDLGLDLGSLASMADGFGSVWAIGQFEQPGVNQLRRFGPTSGSVEATFRLPVGAGGEWGGDGLVIGDGYVWARAWNSATIFRIDPADNAVTKFPLDGRVVSELAIDQVTGELWAAIAGKADEGWTLVKLDPNDGAVLSSTDYKTDWSGGLLPLDGTVWQLSRHVRHSTVYGGYLHQILPGSAQDVPTGGSFALPVTDGRSIWTPASGDNDAMNLASGIAQVDASGQVLQTWEVGSVDYDVAVGDDGGVWFLGSKGLERLNPTTGDMQSWRSTPDGETPVLIVVGADGVWVGTYEGHLFFRPFV
jgi:streptogramin lyase